MNRKIHLIEVLKNLSFTELILLATLAISTIGWVYRAESAIYRGNERQIEVECIKKDVTEFKLETTKTLSEVKTLAKSTDDNVKILLARLR